MRLSTLCMATLLSLGAAGIAHATPVNIINNGDFSATSPAHTNPTQFQNASGSAGSPACNWGGQFVSGWTANGGYGIWYPNAAAASGTSACTQYGNASTQRLPAAVTAPPVGSGSFIGLDGQPGLHFGVSQDLTGLTPGAKYTVSFSWGATQEMSREGATTEYLTVSLGGQSFNTPTQSIATQGWTGWLSQSYTFLANSANETLSFLSIGTPANLPPFAVLAGVSMTKDVPEPPVLAMFGGGLLGLGLLIVFARRREMHRRAADGNSTIV